MQASESGQLNLTTSAKQIVDSDHYIYVAKITNLSTVDVYIGFNSSVSVNTGDLLIGRIGAFVIIETSSSLYACGASSSAKISYIVMRKN